MVYEVVSLPSHCLPAAPSLRGPVEHPDELRAPPGRRAGAGRRAAGKARRPRGARQLQIPIVRWLYFPVDRLLGSSAGFTYVSTNGPGPST